MSTRWIRPVVFLAVSLVICSAVMMGITRWNPDNIGAMTPTATSEQVLPDFEIESSTKPQVPASLPPIIGWLDVPTANIKHLGITRGIDGTTLATGLAGAYPYSGPGQTGVFAMAAHRLGYGGPFRHLDQLQLGDQISVTERANVYKYRVTRIAQVTPDTTSVLNGSASRAQLVLITCTPIPTFTHRLVITADLVE